MSKKLRYDPLDVHYLDRLYWLEMKTHLEDNPTHGEIDFLEQKITQLRHKIDQLKTTFYKQKETKQMIEDFYRRNLGRQNTYLDLLLEKKILFEKKTETKKAGKIL